MAKAKFSESNAECRVTEFRRIDNGRRLVKEGATVVVERRLGECGKVPRRRQIDPTTCERDYSVEEIEFMDAMDSYKRKSGRMFPTCSEFLEVIRSLGYIRPDAAVQARDDAELQPSAERTIDVGHSATWA